MAAVEAVMSVICGQLRSWKVLTAHSLQSLGRLVMKSKTPGSSRRLMFVEMGSAASEEMREVSGFARNASDAEESTVRTLAGCACARFTIPLRAIRRRTKENPFGNFRKFVEFNG